MREKLPSTLKYLLSWTDKILNDSKGKEWSVLNFVNTFGLNEFISFYNELVPFVIELNNVDIALFGNDTAVFENNKKRLDEAKKDNWLADVVFSLLSEHYFARSANDLIQVLKDIKANTENINYSLIVSKS